MAKALSKEQLEFLYKLYYENGMVFGRDTIFEFVKSNFPELGISRRQIAEWLTENQPGCYSQDVVAKASTGIPDDVTVESPAPPAPSSITSEAERAIHPEFCGSVYDQVHTKTMKVIDKLFSIWPKKRSHYNVEVAKAEGHPVCRSALDSANKDLAICEELIRHLVGIKTEAAVHGGGYHSRLELEQCQKKCEEVMQIDKDIAIAVKALVPLQALNLHTG